MNAARRGRPIHAMHATLIGSPYAAIGMTSEVPGFPGRGGHRRHRQQTVTDAGFGVWRAGPETV